MHSGGKDLALSFLVSLSKTEFKSNGLSYLAETVSSPLNLWVVAWLSLFIEVDNDISSREMRTMQSTARKHEQRG